MTETEIRYRVAMLMRRAQKLEATMISARDALASLVEKAEVLVQELQPRHAPLPGQGLEVPEHVDG